MEKAATEAVGACPACEGTSRTFLYMSHDWMHGLPGEFPLERCQDCQSVYPSVRPTPQALGAYYPEEDYYAYATAARSRLFARREPAARLWYSASRGLLRTRYGYSKLGGSALLGSLVGSVPPLRRRATFSLAVLLHPWQAGGALLDVGCGAGGYLDLMRALGWERVVGVDVSGRGVENARDTLRIEAHRGQLAEIGFAEATFDAVSLSHTLEHVADPVGLLREVRRVTRPGGRIAILVPNVRSLLARLLGRYWIGLDTPRHLVCFSPAGLRTVVERSGLRLELLETTSIGSKHTAAFSIARARGDTEVTYTGEAHRFPAHRRMIASLLDGLEGSLCASGVSAGEQISVVARR